MAWCRLGCVAIYRYSNLTSAIKDKTSPIRQHFDRRYPNGKLLQGDFRAQSGSLRVDGGDAGAGLMGTAFDLLVRFLLNPKTVPVAPSLAFLGTPYEDAVRSVIVAAQEACASQSHCETLNRACWALAHASDVCRAGLFPDSPIAQLLREGRFTSTELLALAPRDALRQMDELRALAETQLLPHVSPPFALGPTFDGSTLCQADADLIASGTLLDIKTRLGLKNRRTGTRSESLALTDIYQIIGYALFDRSDRYHIDTVGIYSARYGSLVTWQLSEVLDGLAGEPVDIEQERATVWQLLGGLTSAVPLVCDEVRGSR